MCLRRAGVGKEIHKFSTQFETGDAVVIKYLVSLLWGRNFLDYVQGWRVALRLDYLIFSSMSYVVSGEHDENVDELEKLKIPMETMS